MSVNSEICKELLFIVFLTRSRYFVDPVTRGRAKSSLRWIYKRLVAPRSGVDPRRRSVEFGHHLCADEAQLQVSDCGDRSVQPVCRYSRYVLSWRVPNTLEGH